MPGSEMIKRKIALLLFMNLAATASAADHGVTLAKIDHSASRPISRKISLPAVTEKYEYYEVRGDNEKALRCQLDQNGCTWDDGKKYDSVTAWHVKWDYDHEQTAETCQADSFRATVDITYRYPKWVRGDKAVQPLVSKWENYMQNLAVHEKGHRDLAVEAAAELTRAVAELPPARSCGDIDREVKALCRTYMQKLSADQKTYDAETTHGVKQGALFP